jgi:hypothetical protein
MKIVGLCRVTLLTGASAILVAPVAHSRGSMRSKTAATPTGLCVELRSMPTAFASWTRSKLRPGAKRW